jgi:uncharacterized membrane protein YqaE (UPF0057 family)
MPPPPQTSTVSALLLILITLFFPPVGVAMIAGCGADLCVNICLTILGVFPGHIHAYYLEYVYYKRREEIARGIISNEEAPGVYSENVQTGGTGGYGTI